MYALFTAIPLVGHLNPLIRQASELKRRGWRVAIACASELRAHVEREAPEMTFVDLGPLGSIAGELRRDHEAASRDRDFLRGTRRIVNGLVRVWPLMFDGLTAAIAADRPDVMVVDLFSAGALCAAEASGVPFVVNNPDLLGALSVRLLPPADHLPFLFSGRSIREVPRWQPLLAPLLRWAASVAVSLTFGRTLNALRRSRGMAPTDVHTMLRERLILVDGVFGLEYPCPLPPNVHMVGPMLPSATEPLPVDLEHWLGSGPPVVYVNLGTLAVPAAAQLRRMLDALTSEEFRVLWILKPEQAARLGPVPATVRILDWGPAPFALLAHPNVRVFVSHCGINSVYEAIAAGTPLVGIPMFADQRDMAVRVADAGVAVWLDKRRFTAEQLRGAVREVLGGTRFVRGLPALQQAIAEAGGAVRAADLIAGVVRVA